MREDWSLIRLASSTKLFKSSVILNICQRFFWEFELSQDSGFLMCLRMRLAVHSVDLFPFTVDQPRPFRMMICLCHLAQSSKHLLSPCEGFLMMLLKVIINSLHHSRMYLKPYEWHSCLLPYPLDLQDCYSYWCKWFATVRYIDRNALPGYQYSLGAVFLVGIFLQVAVLCRELLVVWI